MNKFLIVIFAFTFLLSGCQSCTKKFGGITHIKLEKNEKFINITWKENDLWILVEKENKFYFKEYSMYGILEGVVEIENKD